jgi:hypothetical protein
MKKGISKSHVIQTILDEIGGRRYVEIGVFKRGNLEKITAKQKIGIDPIYYIAPSKHGLVKILDRLHLRYLCLKFWRRLKGERFFRMDSRSFFKKHDKWLRRNPIDVCFIDGLHTYHQALEDVLNTLKYLSRSGVIVMHDCCPTTAQMAYPAESYQAFRKIKSPGSPGSWCGDVWKAIVCLRSHRSDLRVCVLNADYGIGIVTRGEPEEMLAHSQEEIARMTYQDLDNDRINMLNLKEVADLKDFLKTLSNQ